MTKDCVHGVGHSPVCKTMLPIVMRVMITLSPPAWTSSAGMLLTPADSLSLIIVLQSPVLCEEWGGHLLCPSGDSSVLMALHWPCSCGAFPLVQYVTLL